MKLKSVLFSGCILMYTAGVAALSPLHQPLHETPITAGAGYSYDTKQVAPQYCYAAAPPILSNIEQKLDFDTAYAFSDFQEQLRYDVSAKGGIGAFSASAEASYLRDVEDKTYSLSVNYFGYADATVAVQLQGAGMNALSSSGQDFYKNDYKNFGILCGDNYIASYKEGALLAMSLNINFKSNYEKQVFEASAGASYGNIFSASSSIQQIAIQNNINGTISLEAYQEGGDPSQLSRILSKDSSGNYYILKCDLQHMNDCVSAASGLLDYASNSNVPNDFPSQFSFKNNTGLTPLGLSFAEYRPITELGLTAPPSLVDQQVQSERDNLATQYSNAQYYAQNFNNLVNGYPVPWDTTSTIYKNSVQFLNEQNANIDVLLSNDNPEEGALGCYDIPENCNAIYQTIEGKLKPILPADLGFLEPLQYYYQDYFADYYYTGSAWGHANHSDQIDQVTDIYQVHFEDPNNINYQINTRSTTDGKTWAWQFTNGVLQPDGKTINIFYSGGPGPRVHVPLTNYKLPSTFYFNIVPPSK